MLRIEACRSNSSDVMTVSRKGIDADRRYYCDERSLEAQRSARVRLDLQHAAGDGVELRQQGGVARFRRRDDGGIQRAIGADRAGLVLAREILRQPRH